MKIILINYILVNITKFKHVCSSFSHTIKIMNVVFLFSIEVSRQNISLGIQ